MEKEENKMWDGSEIPENGAGEHIATEETQETGGDNLTDEEKEQQIEENRNPPSRKDPTDNMSDGQKVDYWAKKAAHFENEYRTERTKRQEYAKKYGGLSGTQGQTRQAPPQQEYMPPAGSIPPNATQDLNSFTQYILKEAERSVQHRMSEAQLDQKVESTEERARQVHNGEDDLPAYDELVDEFVVPMIQKNPKIFELIRLMPDPAETSYTIGFLLKYPKFSDMIKSQSREELVKNINNGAKFAATVKGRGSGRQPTGKLTAAEINSMSPEDFEKELEKFRAQS